MKEKLLITLFTGMMCISVISVKAENISIFEELPDSFGFSSGVGAWGTSLELNDDGSFIGEFHDTNMGETGDGYPNGTVYICKFTGKFTEPEKINDYTYAMNLEYLGTDHVTGEAFYENGMKHVYSGPYGFDYAEEFYIYLPGTPVSDVAEEFMTWSHLPLDTTTYLPEDFYGIYNVKEGIGFVGYLNDTDNAADVSNILYDIEMEDERLNAAKQNAMTQMEINTYSDALYTLWDDELNSIWKKLKNNLDEQTMTQLTNEQLQWIYDKEAAAGREAAPYEGGSLYSAIYSDSLYRWTKDRVYYLIEMFPDINIE